jgi:hypothetical protein
MLTPLTVVSPAREVALYRVISLNHLKAVGQIKQAHLNGWIQFSLAGTYLNTFYIQFGAAPT